MIHLLWTLAVSGVVLALGLSLLLRWPGGRRTSGALCRTGICPQRL